MPNGTVTVKRSPFILIRTLIGIELLAFLVYWLVTGHGSYKSDIYGHLFFSNLLSYDVAKQIFLSAAQLVITLYAFASWYLESYILQPGSLIHQWGVIFKKNRTVPLTKSMTVTTSFGPFGKWFHYGSVHIENDSSSAAIVLSDISRPEEFMNVVEQYLNPEKGHFVKPDITNLLRADEHERLEFKSSLRFDYRAGNVNRELERAVMKTVAAFLNTRGGELVIGVNDKREPMGLLADYKTMQRPSSDGFENHFTQVFNAMIGPEFRQLVKLWFAKIDAADVCVIQVAPSPRPVYFKIDDDERFYVRTGNTTTSLKLSEVDAYRRSRWPRRAATNA